MACLWLDHRQKIFRLGVSFIWLSFTGHKEWIDRKLYHNQIKYKFTFFVYTCIAYLISIVYRMYGYICMHIYHTHTHIYISRSTYIASTGETRRSQSAIFFNSKSKQGEETNNRTSKRKREEQTPNILEEEASTCTLVNEDTNQMTSSLPKTPATNKNKEQVALKLDRLKDKLTKYESHKDFLTRCIAEKLIPKGLKLELEPTIGNFDQEFVDEWYSKLKGFSLILMKDITTYCEKTIKYTNDSIKNTGAIFRNLTENQEFPNIDQVLKTNAEATKYQL